MLRAPAFVLLTVPDFPVKGNGQRGFEGSKEKKHREKKRKKRKKRQGDPLGEASRPRRRQRSPP
jgi:hypothetical protein